jgi:excisionase family DNA binding protein
VPTYTMEEVAKELRVHEQTVRRWVKAGKIKVIRLGHRTVRITDEELKRIKREGLKQERVK